MHRFKKWRDALQIAPTPEEVVGVIHAYVRTLPPEAVGALPDACKAALAVKGANDVQAAAVTLLQCELVYSGKPADGDVLHEIAHTFAAASVRITNLGQQRPALLPQ